MKSHLYHLQINIDFQNREFYKGLLEFMGWEMIFENDEVFGYTSASSGDMWFVKANNNQENDYDAKGVNHISLRVSATADVDRVKDFLESDGVKMMFDTPKHRPEFASSESETYYQIMFESPDKVLFEVVYLGEK